MNPRSQTYAGFLRNKTIAVVGPAPMVGDQSGDIELHDLIVRFEWFGGPVQDGAGTRTDISYYNNAVGKVIARGEKEIPDGIWACFKSRNYLVRGSRQRYSYVPEYRGPNMVPIACHDLIKCGAMSVKVFGANFYLSESPYGREDYSVTNQHRTDDQIMERTLVHHNQNVQRQYMRRMLSENPNLTGDERFLEIVNMDDLLFRRALDTMWRKPQTRSRHVTKGKR